MKIEFDREADALYIRLGRGKVAYSEEIKPGVVVDYSQKGKPLGVEVLEASKLMAQGISIPDKILAEIYAKKAV